MQGEDSQLKRSSRKETKGIDPTSRITNSSAKKGTVAGAVALIIGTSIGSGILALPNKTSPAVTRYFYHLRSNYSFFFMNRELM